MSPCETYKSSRPTVEARAKSTASSYPSSDYIPEGRLNDDDEYECDSIANSDDSDAVPDSDYESESESDGCQCGTCDRPDFKRRPVIGSQRTSHLTVLRYADCDKNLGRRKSRCEISQAERQSSNSQNPPPSDRPTVYRRVSRRQSIASASQVKATTLQIPQKTELSPPTSSLGGNDCAQDKQASDGGLYGDVISAECESLRWELEQAKAQGYFDHGVDAWQ
jgi:hypothetical protein